jgi:hypothetical protein
VNKILRGRARPSRLLLPVVGPAEPRAARPVFEPAANLPPTAVTQTERPTWQVIDDVIEGHSAVQIRDGHRVRPIGEAYEVEEEQTVEAAASDARPEHAYAKSLQRMSMFQPDGRTDVIGRVGIRSTTGHLHVDVELSISVDGQHFFHKQWLETVPRHFL